MSEPRDVANEIIEGLYDKVAKLHPVDVHPLEDRLKDTMSRLEEDPC